MPNPSGKMNEREREICSRVRAVRERFHQSERNFAKLLGITRDKLAGIEYCRTPLQFGIALAVVTATGCNLYWLAEGDGPERGPLPSPDLTDKIPPRRSLAVVWRTILKPLLPHGKKYFGDGWDGLGQGSEVGGLSAREYSIEEIDGYFELVPPQLQWSFYSHISKACRDFVKVNHVKIIELNAKATGQPKTHLTKAETSAKLGGDVKKQLPSLLERLKKATKETGKMSALAEYLKVPLASVSRWIAGSREPGGEIALQLLHWVEQEERQK